MCSESGSGLAWAMSTYTPWLCDVLFGDWHGCRLASSGGVGPVLARTMELGQSTT